MEGVPYFGEYGYVPPQKGKFPFKEVAIGFGVLLLIGIAIYGLREYFKKPCIEAKNQLSSNEGTQEQTVPEPPVQMPIVYADIPSNKFHEFRFVPNLKGYVHQSQYHLLGGD